MNTQMQGTRRTSAGKRRLRRRKNQRFFILGLCAAAVAVLLCLALFQTRQTTDRMAEKPQQTRSISQESPSETIVQLTEPSDPENSPSGPAGQADETSDPADQETEASDTPWYLILVNRSHPLPEGYQDQLELTQLSNGQSVDSRIYPSLQAMFDQMRAEGVYPVVASGFRTTAKQQSLMDERIESYKAKGYSDEKARREAENWVAIPGTSEHQLGSAVDINADGVHSAGYQVYEWLDKHAHEYGFIHRYPEDKTRITGISNEPWHYRYVGEEAAAEIHRRGICLEEYLGE